MASEELEQRYPKLRGAPVGVYEVFECQLVTINQFAQQGLLPQKDYGGYKSQKCDSLVIGRVPSVHAVAVGEHKQPGELSESTWVAVAADMLKTKCLPIGVRVGFVTDGVMTRWINGAASPCQK